MGYGQYSMGMIATIFFFLGSVAIVWASFWRIFEKCGIDGWKSLIPVYGLIVYLDILERNRYEAIFILIPFINLLYAILWTIELSRKFGRSNGAAALLVFFPMAGFPVLAFGDAEYQGSRNGRTPKPIPPYNPQIVLYFCNLILIIGSLYLMGFDRLFRSSRLISYLFASLGLSIPYALAIVLLRRSKKFDISLIAATVIVSGLWSYASTSLQLNIFLAFILSVAFVAALWSLYGYALDRFRIPSLPSGFAVLFVVYMAVSLFLNKQTRFPLPVDPEGFTISHRGLIALGLIILASVLSFTSKRFKIPVAVLFGAAVVIASLIPLQYGLLSGFSSISIGLYPILMFLSIILPSGACIPGFSPSYSGALLSACSYSFMNYLFNMSAVDINSQLIFFSVFAAIFIVLNLFLSEKRGKELAKAALF